VIVNTELLLYSNFVTVLIYWNLMYCFFITLLQHYIHWVRFSIWANCSAVKTWSLSNPEFCTYVLWIWWHVLLFTVY